MLRWDPLWLAYHVGISQVAGIGEVKPFSPGVAKIAPDYAGKRETYDFLARPALAGSGPPNVTDLLVLLEVFPDLLVNVAGMIWAQVFIFAIGLGSDVDPTLALRFDLLGCNSLPLYHGNEWGYKEAGTKVLASQLSLGVERHSGQLGSTTLISSVLQPLVSCAGGGGSDEINSPIPTCPTLSFIDYKAVMAVIPNQKMIWITWLHEAAHERTKTA